jgi:dolichol-phosphate mannosyltransferase
MRALSVVIPTRHESRTIAGFVHRVLRTVADIPLELVVVDDSDTDDTFAVLQQLSAELAGRLVIHHRKEGSVADRTLGTAVVQGIRMAHGEYICVMDADGQHPPELIQTMLSVARRTGADYVGATRYAQGGSAEGLNGVTRKIISRALASIARAMFWFTPIRQLTDPLSGFFLVRRVVVDGVDLRPIGWKISLEVLMRTETKRVAEVPYTFCARQDDDSKATMSQGLLVLRHMATLLLTGSRPKRLVMNRKAEAQLSADLNPT